MATYMTPGVYVEEISTLPPSVAEVSTAIPAFLGYTEKGPAVARINTLLDYEDQFGGPPRASFSVKTGAGPIAVQRAPGGSEFLTYYCVSHYFRNGGGSCYIISLGDYTSQLTADDFLKGLTLLEKEDEPTLILLPDATNLKSADYYSVCQAALAQCNKLGDRFAILDVKGGNVAEFRNSVGSNNLKYGAAYHPYLQTTLSYWYRDDDVMVASSTAGPARWSKTFGANGVTVSYQGAEAEPKVKIVQGTAGNLGFEIAGGVLTIRNVAGETGSTVSAAWAAWKADTANNPAGFEITQAGDGSETPPSTTNANVSLDPQATTSESLVSLKSSKTALYQSIKSALAAERVVLPPSAAVAGIYATVDRERGVWKAPANVSVAAVIGPVVKITQEEQEGLNIDPTGGKSINAIRAFTGKGTLIWGARTLAGNDNEWRYVPVRRLFNLIEESSRKSTAFAVFESNDATTWLKVKGMIESYLYGLWERGALAGSTPEAAYFVNVGLGKTMTAQDVLEGRMIVEIGVAAVRPAEFIILRFTHKLQQA